MYLGAKIKPMRMNNGVTAWTISPSKYVKEAINNYEKWIQENMSEPKHGHRASNPFSTDYDPDLDTTAELDEEQSAYYQSQICILCWIVDLGGLTLQQMYHCWPHILHSQDRDTYRQYFLYMPTLRKYPILNWHWIHPTLKLT